MENQKETVSEPISSELLKELLYVYFFEKGEDGRDSGYKLLNQWIGNMSEELIYKEIYRYSEYFRRYYKEEVLVGIILNRYWICW